MSTEPRDEVIKKEIIANIDNVQVSSIRPNKLRKIICKKIDGTNWTQYQRVLDSLIEGNVLRAKAVNGELMILPSLANCQNQSKKQERENSSECKKKSEVILAPLAIIRHLIKKGHQKQNNIEKNSKSKISFSKESLEAVRSKQFNHGDQANITITKYYEDDEELADKQMKNALLMVTKMVQAYNNNPDHFRQTEAGGTLKYQKEVKTRKLEAGKKRGRKTPNEENGETRVGKKRERKYY